MKDFCHSGHFFDIHVNYACCKAKPLLTVYIMNGQHKICPICPSQANTGKAKRRTAKRPATLMGCRPIFCFAFYLLLMSALLPQAPPVNAYAFSTRQTYSKFFSLNGHSSTTTQPRHSGLRALQILRPCQINQ